MYKLTTTDGTELGYTDSVNYIKISNCNAYVSCEAKDAIGIAYKSNPYNIGTYTLIPDVETVMITEVSADEVMATTSKLQADLDYLAMMADVDLTIETESESTVTIEEVTENE